MFYHETIRSRGASYAMDTSSSSNLSDTASSTALSLSSFLSTVTKTAYAQASELTVTPDLPPQTSWLGMLGQVLVAMAKGIPGLLIWIITFSSITLPTFLFALFSTSLTFTMNFTTLCVQSTDHGEHG